MHFKLQHWLEVSGQLHAPAALPPEKKPRYQLDVRLGGLQSRYESGGEEKKSLHLPRIESCSFSPKCNHYMTEVLRLHVEIW
jgi:hypothetical protein